MTSFRCLGMHTVHAILEIQWAQMNVLCILDLYLGTLLKFGHFEAFYLHCYIFCVHVQYNTYFPVLV